MSLVLPLFLISCEKTPVANFSVDTYEPEVGQKVLFTNNSHDAERFEWNFGDGYTSNDANPIHIFNSTGPFEVSLTAISKSGLEDVSTLTLKVMVPTLLEIQVLEYYDEYIVPDASVILYPSESDWDAQSNKLSEGFTDANGTVVFSNLDRFVYYADVWEQNHDNYALRSEDVGFIRTPEVLPHQINYFVAWVDYVPHTKGVKGGARSVIIRKLERKAEDKSHPATYSGTENWQELYNRRSGK